MTMPERQARSDAEPRRSPTLLDLGLRGPTLGVLQRQGILSVDQLIHMTPEDLMGMRRVGLSRVLEIRQALQSQGLDLRTEPNAQLPRTWTVAQRIRLICCDTGECTLDLKSAGIRAEAAKQLFDDFVAAHRSCPRLAGREPVVSTAETAHPRTGTFASPDEPVEPDFGSPTQPAEPDEERKARTA